MKKMDSFFSSFVMIIIFALGARIRRVSIHTQKKKKHPE